LNVNILTVELDESLDRPGFRHDATSIGRRLGARRIGAAVYEAEPGVPIWPYHYHHGIEEWLYAIAGAPVLRDPSGERVLTPGDLVCFPSGHTGAHTVKGPGRFVIFDTGREREPFMSVYPDSDKVSGPHGMLLRSSAVGYWHGEGTGEPDRPVPAHREPETSPPQPIVNVHTAGAGRLGPQLGARRLDATVAEESDAFHYTFGREEWLLVLAGTPALRRPDGEERLEPGDVVCFPEGPDGAHQLINRGGSDVRALLMSTTGVPANVCYPDTGEWRMHNV
jgi:uncharacterized cupin superfamily protein